MNKISPFLARYAFLLVLALMVAWDSTAQIFESRIVFVSNRDGDWDIYSMDVNGDKLTQLTDHPATDRFPGCSPDGRRIAFISERGITDDLYVMDSDGSNVVRLTHDNFREGRPSWTPDGTKIAFSNFIFAVGNSEIYLMDPDGTGVINLTKHKWHEVRPSWSPDGSKMAFVSFRTGAFNDPRHIFVMNADGTGRRNLTGDTALRESWAPNWSPDETKIVFESRRHPFPQPTRDDIFVITADGKELEQLTEDGRSRSPVYSPDGTKIAYVSGRGGDRNIFLMDTNGDNAVKLTKSPPGTDNVMPTWLPLGAYAVNPNGKLPISWGELKATVNP